MQGTKELHPKMLYQVYLQDLVSEDNFYRFVKAITILQSARGFATILEKLKKTLKNIIWEKTIIK